MVDVSDMDAVGADDIHIFLDRAMVMLCHGHSPSRSGGGSPAIIRMESESAPEAETGRPKAALASFPHSAPPRRRGGPAVRIAQHHGRHRPSHGRASPSATRADPTLAPPRVTLHRVRP